MYEYISISYTYVIITRELIKRVKYKISHTITYIIKKINIKQSLILDRLTQNSFQNENVDTFKKSSRSNTGLGKDDVILSRLFLY